MKDSKYVLIVDDDPVFCRLMSHLLSTWGLQVESYVEPRAFLERAKAVHPRLCLVDLNLGDPLRGFGILTTLRELFPATPVFIVSGTSEGKLVAQALELGASDYLVKPVDREVLVAKLGDYLKTQELEIARPGASSAKSVEIGTRLSLPGKIVAVDELGLTLLSPHLIAKGAKMKISGELVASLTGAAAPLEVTALSSALEPDTGLFRTYLELPPGDASLLDKARSWIRARKPAQS